MSQWPVGTHLFVMNSNYLDEIKGGGVLHGPGRRRRDHHHAHPHLEPLTRLIPGRGGHRAQGAGARAPGSPPPPVPWASMARDRDLLLGRSPRSLRLPCSGCSDRWPASVPRPGVAGRGLHGLARHPWRRLPRDPDREARVRAAPRSPRSGPHPARPPRPRHGRDHGGDAQRLDVHGLRPGTDRARPDALLPLPGRRGGGGPCAGPGADDPVPAAGPAPLVQRRRPGAVRRDGRLRPGRRSTRSGSPWASPPRPARWCS